MHRRAGGAQLLGQDGRAVTNGPRGGDAAAGDPLDASGAREQVSEADGACPKGAGDEGRVRLRPIDIQL